MMRTMVAVAALLATAGAAEAQDIRGVPVSDRARPDYDALGIRAGAFLIRPAVTVSGVYDDNVFADDDDLAVDDLIALVSPSVSIASNWNVHSLRLRGAANIGRYQDFSSEDYEDYLVGADGRLDITRGDALNATLEYRREHEERGSPNDAGGREPTEYDLVSGLLGYERSGRRISLNVRGSFNDYDFDDVPGLGTTIIDQDFRDRVEYAVGPRIGYEFRPGVTTFVEGIWNTREYDNGLRDSDGYRVNAGFAFDFGGITMGELFAGYRDQEYDNPAFTSESGFTYGGNVLWLPTGLTSVQLRLINEVNESTTAGASGYVSSGISVQVDHELLRNVLIGASAGYAENDFTGVDRKEEILNFAANVDYLFNRNFRVGVGYRYTNRDVNAVNDDYSRNAFTVSLRAAL